jgi:hypothetical protein
MLITSIKMSESDFEKDYWQYVDDSIAYGFEEVFTDLQILDLFEGQEKFTKKTGDCTYEIVSYPRRKMSKKEQNMYNFLMTKLWFQRWLSDNMNHGWFIGDGKTIRLPQLVSEEQWKIVRKISGGTIPKPPSVSYFNDYDPKRTYTSL